ncbi:GNAT family N-acetyltransferase [Planococcus lenghuensis]|uniref:N-acetyltransferase domain-containing protein n=1 Tax=Planococcus lenghuensis TaxID=2213202 RepID=A0A1Q2KZ41_9BACL|nr:GNAT family N-acetyltransferase [Planococcus lenghuensis]AQQ53394.1 hypothetical protein B0X71_10130 [Planococcus lenghuensis]
MLVKYKKTCEKIAMGLLGLMPNERNVKELQKLIRIYEEKPEMQLYFWREGEDYIGLLGLEMEGDHVVVCHIAVNPSHRGEGLGQVMVEQIEQRVQPRKVKLTQETEKLCLTVC